MSLKSKTTGALQADTALITDIADGNSVTAMRKQTRATESTPTKRLANNQDQLDALSVQLKERTGHVVEHLPGSIRKELLRLCVGGRTEREIWHQNMLH